MHRHNLSQSEFTYDSEDPAGFRAGMCRLGPRFEAQQTGTSIYELPPGEALCPYHYEYAEEEWLMVVSGTPSVRDPDGTHELEEGDVLFFPRGPAGAHQVRNDGDAPARVLMWSTVIQPAATVYPDSDKIAVWTGNREDDLIAPRSSKVGYYHGESG